MGLARDGMLVWERLTLQVNSARFLCTLMPVTPFGLVPVVLQPPGYRVHVPPCGSIVVYDCCAWPFLGKVFFSCGGNCRALFGSLETLVYAYT